MEGPLVLVLLLGLRMVERFGKILLTTPGEEFEQLDTILEAFEKKEFMFTDKVLFNKVSNESNNN